MFRLGGWRGATEAVLWIAILAVLVRPFLALVAGSLAPAYGVPFNLEMVTLHAYEEILLRQSVTRTAFANSTLLALSTAAVLLVISVLFGYYVVRSRSRISAILAVLAEIPYALPGIVIAVAFILLFAAPIPLRSEEHTSELQSLMRISYA